MVNRDRAWRRKKTRLIVKKLRDTKEWIVSQFTQEKPRAVQARKPSRHGKLTKAQQLRQAFSLQQEMADGWIL